MNQLRLYCLLLWNHFWKSGLLFQLLFCCVVFHWGGLCVHRLFHSEIFGDLSLSSVIPMPSRAKLNIWMLVGSGFFSAGVIGSSLLPYFLIEGRERSFYFSRGTWWRFSLGTLLLSALWFTSLIVVVFLVSRGLSGFEFKPQVSLFRIGLVLIAISISLTYTVASVSLFISPGVALVITGTATLGVLLMTMLDRFGLWAERGVFRFLVNLFPSGDLGFDVWKWINGEKISNATIIGCLISGFVAFIAFTYLVRYLPLLRRRMLRA